MNFAYNPSPLRTIIVAAGDTDAFRALAARLLANDAGRARHPTLAERMLDSDLERFDPEHQPIIIDHVSEDDAKAFARAEDLHMVPVARAFDRYLAMVRPVLDDRRAKAPRDVRTIAEIHGLDKNDRWDPRNSEQRERDAAAQDRAKKMFEEAAKRGQLSSDSFAAPKGADVKITDIGSKVEGGKIILDALGTKGLHDRNADQERADRIEQAELSARSHDDYHDPDDGGSPQSRRAGDYLFAAIDTQAVGDPPFAVIVSKLFWLRSGALEERALTDALAGVLPRGLVEQDPGEFTGVDDVATLIDTMIAAGFEADQRLKDWYLGTYRTDGGLLGLMDAPPQDAIATTPQRPRRSGGHDLPPESFTGEAPPPEGKFGLTEYIDENGDDTLICPDKQVSTYYRCALEGTTVEAVDPLLVEAMGFRAAKRIFAKRNASYGCWYACLKAEWAQDIANVVRGVATGTRVEAVDPRGVPKASPPQAPVKPQRPMAIRPWNARRPVWDALTPGEKEENRKTWTGDEFYVCGSETVFGCTIRVCPIEWFQTRQTFYPEDIDISHMMPAGVVKIGPWTYRDTTKKDWNKFSFEIENVRKFKDNVLLQSISNVRE